MEKTIAAAPGQFWLTIVCAWASVASRWMTETRPASSAACLAPYRHLICFNGAYVVGSVAMYDGLLALILRRQP